MSKQSAKTKPEEIVVTNQDILFDCPSCGKSLVVDVSAEGMIVDCPQCRTNVIVPPRSSTLSEPPASATRATPSKEEAKSTEGAGKSGAADVPAQKRLAVLASQLKELQTQRGEVTGRIASRLNEVNRDLVMLARLETSQQQILSEWGQLVEKVSPASRTDEVDASKPVVVGSSVDTGSRTRIPIGG